MAIPDKPLEITDFDPEDLTLDELMIFSEPDKFKVSIFKSFMDTYSNWTAEEVGGMKVREMKDVFEQLKEELGEASVPLSNSTPSENGPE